MVEEMYKEEFNDLEMNSKEGGGANLTASKPRSQISALSAKEAWLSHRTPTTSSSSALVWLGNEEPSLVAEVAPVGVR